MGVAGIVVAVIDPFPPGEPRWPVLEHQTSPVVASVDRAWGSHERPGAGGCRSVGGRDDQIPLTVSMTPSVSRPIQTRNAPYRAMKPYASREVSSRRVRVNTTNTIVANPRNPNNGTASRKLISVGPAMRTPMGIATRRLNVLLPRTFVRLVTSLFCCAARTLTNASGRLVPTAMTVSPTRERHGRSPRRRPR